MPEYTEFIDPRLTEIQSAMSRRLSDSFADTAGLDSVSLFFRSGTETNPVALAVSSAVSENSDGFATDHVVGKSIDLLPPTRLKETFIRGYGSLALSTMNPNHLTWGMSLERDQHDAVVQASLQRVHPDRRADNELHTRFRSVNRELTVLSDDLYDTLGGRDMAQELWIEPQTSPNACLIAYDLKDSTTSIAEREYPTVRYIEELNEAYGRILAEHGGRKSQKGGDGYTFLLELPGSIRHNSADIAVFETDTVEPILALMRQEHARISAKYVHIVPGTDIHLAHTVGTVRTIGYNDTGKAFWDLHEKLKQNDPSV